MMDHVNDLHARIGNVFTHKLNIEIPGADIDLFETGVLDSLAFVELLLHLECEFGVTVPVDDLEIENFRTIVRVADFVLSRTAHPRESAADAS
jgi:D-alanine--poly(phosphoribitol) ligase subunit 2